MQCNPGYPQHTFSQVCQVGLECCTQIDSAIASALALRQLFCVEGEVLEKVESFRYLRRILAQDDEDIRVVRNQIKKARSIWSRVGQVLQADNTLPRSSAEFYKAVVRSVLFYGSKTWNLSLTALAWLEKFHIRAAYHMAKVHKPWRGSNQVWVYPGVGRESKKGDWRHNSRGGNRRCAWMMMTQTELGIRGTTVESWMAYG